MYSFLPYGCIVNNRKQEGHIQNYIKVQDLQKTFSIQVSKRYALNEKRTGNNQPGTRFHLF
jgi:hypothetical protein